MQTHSAIRTFAAVTFGLAIVLVPGLLYMLLLSDLSRAAFGAALLAPPAIALWVRKGNQWLSELMLESWLTGLIFYGAALAAKAL